MNISQQGNRLSCFEQLLVAARSDDREALGRLLNCYVRFLLHAARNHFPADLRAKAGPSDLVQDTFLAAVRDFHQFRGTTEGQLITWLETLLKHKRLNFIRAFRQQENRRVGREESSSATKQQANRDLVSTTPGPQAEAILHESVESSGVPLQTCPPINGEPFVCGSARSCPSH